MGRAAHIRGPGHVALAACLLVASAVGAAGCEGDPTDPAATTSPSPGAASPTPPGTGPTADAASPTPTRDLANLVIVTFDVDWQPEPGLSASEASAQRVRIERAQQAVLDALGPEARVVRELHATAQASLAVSDDGLARLDGLPEVAAVDADTPAAPDAPDSTG